MAPLYRAAHSRSQKLACLSLGQVEELLPLLNGDLEVVSSPEKSDVQKGWRLAGVGAHGCRDLGMVRCVLKAAQAAKWKDLAPFSGMGLNSEAAPGSCGSLKSLAAPALGPAVFASATNIISGAADAWACAHLAGLGGWFETEGKLFWFHLELKAQDMPEDWGWPAVMQKAIGALELLGQLALVILRAGWARQQLGRC